MNPEPGPLPVPNILIVDDTPANLQVLSGMLECQGFKARPVRSGAAALRAADLVPPDLILLDVGMPEMDGYETCTRLKQMPKLAGVPIIFITAHTDLAEKVRGLSLGAVDFITKPFSLEEVEARIRTHLDLARLRQAQAREVDRLEETVRHRTQELAEARARLLVLDQAKSDFLNLISHELRTPLNGILGVTEIILQNSSDPAVAACQSIYEQGRHSLLTLIDDALLITRISADPNAAGEASELGDLLRQARDGVVPFARHRGVEIGPLPALAGRVRIPAEYLLRALCSLLETAVKFTVPGATVRLAGAPGDGVFRLSLEADGTGLPEEALPGFFELLSQGRPVVPGGDLGLGPALAERIVSLHGGRVTIANLPQPGIRLTVQLAAAC